MADGHRHGGALEVFRRTPGSGAHAPHGPRHHTGDVLTYLVAGRADLRIGHPLAVEVGSFVILPAGVPHSAGPQEAFEAWGVLFCCTCVGLTPTSPLMEPFRRVRQGAAPVVPVVTERRPGVVALFERLHEESLRTAPEAAEVADALLRVLLGELLRAAPSADSPAHPDTLAGRAVAHIQTHALGPLSLKDVAEAVHVTPTHLATVVRQETGHTVGDWIRSVRVAAASRWLLHSDASLDDIASRVGWNDTTHFIRQFKRVQGTTPAAWRRAVRDGRDSSVTRP